MYSTTEYVRAARAHQRAHKTAFMSRRCQLGNICLSQVFATARNTMLSMIRKPDHLLHTELHEYGRMLVCRIARCLGRWFVRTEQKQHMLAEDWKFMCVDEPFT